MCVRVRVTMGAGPHRPRIRGFSWTTRVNTASSSGHHPHCCVLKWPLVLLDAAAGPPSTHSQARLQCPRWPVHPPPPSHPPTRSPGGRHRQAPIVPSKKSNILFYSQYTEQRTLPDNKDGRKQAGFFFFKLLKQSNRQNSDRSQHSSRSRLVRPESRTRSRRFQNTDQRRF